MIVRPWPKAVRLDCYQGVDLVSTPQATHAPNGKDGNESTLRDADLQLPNNNYGQQKKDQVRNGVNGYGYNQISNFFMTLKMRGGLSLTLCKSGVFHPRIRVQSLVFVDDGGVP